VKNCLSFHLRWDIWDAELATILLGPGWPDRLRVSPLIHREMNFATQQTSLAENRIPSQALFLSTEDRGLRAISFLACALFFCALISYNFVDIDLWHEMALIRESVAAGHLLKTDPYAYTPTVHPWVDHEWGAGAIAYFATRWFGSRAIIFLKYGTALGTAIACFVLAKARSTDFRLFTLCAPLAAILAYLGFFSTIRAQAYSFFFAAVLLCLLEMDRNRSRSWIIPWLVIFPIWVNLHAGFVVGIAFVALHAIEQIFRGNRWQHLLWPLLVMNVEIVINPYGTDYFGYLRRSLFLERPYSPEWNSVLTLGSAWVGAFLLAIVIGWYGLAQARWRNGSGLFILSATAIEAVLHRKMLPFFAIAWLCYVPGYLPPTKAGKWWLGFSERWPRFLSAAWGVFAVICLWAGIRFRPWELVVPQPLYPVGAVQYLGEENFAGNLMVPFRLGAYVSWKLYPAVKVSLDSRYEVAYPDPVVKGVFDFYGAESGWLFTLTDSHTDAVLLPTDAAVGKELRTTEWHRVYVDRQFEIYTRPGLSLAVVDSSGSSFQGSFP